ncbi:hypothetical protein ARMGADRAFT_455988 [Armillaria gallica]|uniref:Uncharacterized protein n=1 Tax=Armillaria gallica TaxID=47427 RepID=A0A2H3CWQ2_ARMGA|nr:hypothetical protein ARMGADRAFT_455988 [Armillaria gallica]
MCTGSSVDRVRRSKTGCFNSMYNLFFRNFHIRVSANGSSTKEIFTFVKKQSIETGRPPLQVVKVRVFGTATDIIEANRTRGPVAKSQIGACELMSLYRDSQHLEDVQITDRLSNSIQQFEVELHVVQEFVKKYRYKTIHHFLYSKPDNDELQRLGIRIDDTPLLFQVLPHTLLP